MLRAFRGTFLVAIDEDDAVENEQRGVGAGLVSLEELRDFLADALVLDVDLEEAGNPVGFSSVELDFESLKELTPGQVRKLYGK